MLDRRRFSVAAPRVWNSLPLGLKTNCDSLRGFKTGLKTYLFHQDYNLPVSLSASDYGDFTRIMALYELYYLLTYLLFKSFVWIIYILACDVNEQFVM